ncbi:hypothetical protein [Cuniculiplasma divulgatum]|jgi:ABC-type long-subunit fatty acid transport system fused permease/ATPase subunit|uniref:Multipass membrane protein n=1 Tax=Cuniculiplasma divulgatum TaxID=1673428 RepID=A0A1N5V8Z6_9ARCH|nr:hypothetical protein [Cuniculiplasma divulgatum]MCI2412661.1 hypothetical protein [Cuniculiplasma sp.]MCL4319826.1 hypothetical protein [Candidatus Thermoplasmatota archaeon]WMT49399.1 MAG: hypothetical protein RE472_00175 [Thermoplasmatales archaeon]SIM69246.1 multipass membrane protein [Cuniculiplasma divulgatum]SJK85076.1 multipass membrane protein [Cuniculiplasma divulgatum]
MTLYFNFNELSILISGVNVVVSLFLLLVSLKAVRKGVGIIKYLSAFFGLVLLDSLYIVITNFGVNFLSEYNQILLEMTALIVMLLFYSGMIRGKKN